MSRWEKELKKKAGKNEPKYPLTAREYKRFIKELSKKYKVPAWQIENTIREVGFNEALRRLEAARRQRKPSPLASLKGKIESIFGKLRRRA